MLLLSQTAEYALRAMTAIAQISLLDSEWASASDIQRRTCIPGPYLSKLLRRLVVSELLVAKRGRGGGFQLARPADDVSFHDILEAVDAVPEGSHCAFGWGECNMASPCPLHEAYSEVTEAFRAWARRTKLGSVDLDRLGARDCPRE